MALAVSGEELLDPYFIVLDGLDECGDHRALEILMNLVLDLSSLPKNFQVFVSSRPEREVSDAWVHYPAEIPTENVDDIEPQETLGDITTYIEDALSNIPARGCRLWPPSKEEIAMFATLCGGIFEIAKIRVRILENSTGIPIEEVFQTLVKDSRRGVASYTAEYLRILRKAYFNGDVLVDDLDADEREKDRHEVIQRFRLVVGTVLTLKNRLGFNALAVLIQMSEREIASVLRPISSIINVPDDRSNPIHFFHATCREFFLGMPRGAEKDHVFFFSDPQGHFLGPYCLELMVDVLRSGRIFNFSIRLAPPNSGQVWEIKLPGHLAYSMVHWTSHLSLTDAADTTVSLLRTFISRHLVAWVEAMIWLEVHQICKGGTPGLIPHEWMLDSLEELLKLMTVSLLYFLVCGTELNRTAVF